MSTDYRRMKGGENHALGDNRLRLDARAALRNRLRADAASAQAVSHNRHRKEVVTMPIVMASGAAFAQFAEGVALALSVFLASKGVRRDAPDLRMFEADRTRG